VIFRSVALKAAYGACCVAAASTLFVSHYARSYVSDISAIGTSHAIVSGPSVGAQTILVMGLESRTDYNGNILPADLLAAMHAGSVQGVKNGVGGQATNTLILIHIFDGGKKAVGWSIPRDDWVTYPQTYDGQSQGKIDQAYGLAYAQSLGQTYGKSGMTQNQRYFQANEAGRTAAVDTVESLTGEHIDHFAEVNLAGFYELAKAFGGIMVCIKPWNGGQNLHDANSGFRAPHAGLLHLAPDQALAYVRERDNLPNGDLDRTHRQQAVVDYVMWKLKHGNILSDLGQLTSLLHTASLYVNTDAGWNLLDFASEMRSLTGKNLSFKTLPIVGFQTIDGQDANVIDTATIKQLVQTSFTPPTTSSGSKSSSKKQAVTYPLSDTVVNVVNSGGHSHFATDTLTGLVDAGFKQGQATTGTAQQATTQVLYGSGAAAKANAARVATLFGVTAQASSAVSAGYVEVILGTSTTTLPSFSSLSSSSAGATSAPSTSASNPATSATDNGAAGGVVSVSSNAPYGVPCVY
jgi:LCP family protein required for cell wall assembly